MYRTDATLRSVCKEANAALGPKSRETTHAANFEHPLNTVYLPGPDRHVSYDATTDVLFLRFGLEPTIPTPSQQPSDSSRPRSAGEPDPPSLQAFASGVSASLAHPAWSGEMAGTLRNARRVALDLGEPEWADASGYSQLRAARGAQGAGVGWIQLVREEVTYLSSCIQQGLEVLYLVDHCVGRCEGCRKSGLKVEELQERGHLARVLEVGRGDGVMEREADAIYGEGVVYREILNFTRLGWTKDYPAFVLAKMFVDAIQEQQGDQRLFQGVRVLACQRQ